MEPRLIGKAFISTINKLKLVSSFSQPFLTITPYIYIHFLVERVIPRKGMLEK